MTIGQRIAQKRKEQNLSQEALGDRLGVSRQAIYKWESDTAVPEIEKLVALSGLFGVSVGWLLGVEDPASPPRENEELTESQLKMVEEIVDRYLEAQPKPAKRKKWPYVLAAFALLWAGFSLIDRLDRIDTQYNRLQSTVSQVQDSVNNQIYGITSRVEDILKAQNNLTADYETAHLSTDPAAGSARFSFRAIPKTFSEGMVAWIEAETTEGTVESHRFEPQGQTFSGEFETTLTDDIKLYIVFEANGTRETQLLDTYYNLYTDSLAYVDLSMAHDSLHHAPLAEEGLFRILHPNHAALRYILVPTNADHNWAQIASVQIGLFKNRELVAWAERCAIPEEYFKGFGDHDCYALPEQLEVPLTPEDELCFAAISTDVYGRTMVTETLPHCAIDPDRPMQLTWVNDTRQSSDPADWTY